MADQLPLPKTTKQWTVTGYDGFDSLKFSEEPIPELGDNQVLVKIQGASLNSRDLLIPQNKYPFPLKPNIIPGSDGAGTVLATGKHVTRFIPGDKVVTTINQTYLAGPITPSTAASGLGGTIDGTFRQFGVFDEQGLVTMPRGLSFVEAATLGCAGVTAWSCLFGGGRRVGPGDWVVAMGTGGVSCFVARFAKGVGARVFGTVRGGSGFEGKKRLLEGLGVDYVVESGEGWGAKVKELTGGVGVDFVVDVAGEKTLGESVNALKLDGMVCVVGFAGGDGGGDGNVVPTILDCWTRLFTARGVWVGSRVQMEEMCRAIEANLEGLRPVVDERVFKLEELKEAYEYLAAGKHQGKVCIAIK